MSPVGQKENKTQQRGDGNLTDWFSLTNTLTLTNGSVIFSDSITNAPQRFYKVLEE